MGRVRGGSVKGGVRFMFVRIKRRTPSITLAELK